MKYRCIISYWEGRQYDDIWYGRKELIAENLEELKQKAEDFIYNGEKYPDGSRNCHEPKIVLIEKFESIEIDAFVKRHKKKHYGFEPSVFDVLKHVSKKHE